MFDNYKELMEAFGYEPVQTLGDYGVRWKSEAVDGFVDIYLSNTKFTVGIYEPEKNSIKWYRPSSLEEFEKLL